MKKIVFKKEYGLSLIELMVALTMGLIMLMALASVYMTASRSSNLRSVNDELDESARQVFERLEQDLKLAGYVDILEKTDLAKVSSSKKTERSYGRLMPTGEQRPSTLLERLTDQSATGVIQPVQGMGDNTLAIAYQSSNISNDNHLSLRVSNANAGKNSGWGVDCLGQNGGLKDGLYRMNRYRFANNSFACTNPYLADNNGNLSYFNNNNYNDAVAIYQPIVGGNGASTTDVVEGTFRYFVTTPLRGEDPKIRDSSAGMFVSNLLSAQQVENPDINVLSWAGVTAVEVCMVIAGAPLDSRVAEIASAQEQVPTCVINNGNYNEKNRPGGDSRLYRRYVKVLAIPNVLYLK